MSDEQLVSEEDLYEQALAEAGKLDAPAVAEEEESAAEALQGEAQLDGSAPEGEATPAEIATAATVDTPAEAAEAENFFPGYADLIDEAKAIVRKTMDAAARAEEYKQQAGKAGADLRATTGKLAPLQKAYDALKAKQQEASTTQTSASKTAAKAALEKFQKEYPDEAEALLAVNSQLESFEERVEAENAELRAQVAELAAERKAERERDAKARERAEKLAVLDQLHPDRAEINESPEWEAWVNAIDQVKLQLLKSADPIATASVLTDFKRDKLIAEHLGAQSAVPATPNTPAPKPLARTVADPNPTTRRTTVNPRSNSIDGMDEEEKYAFYLQQAGHTV